MVRYEFEQKLDAMLQYFVDKGKTITQASKLPPDSDNDRMVSILRHLGLIKPLVQHYQSGNDIVHNDLLCISDSGIYFHFSSSFVGEAVLKAKERKRWNIEFRKLTSDTILSVFAILISITALYFSLM